MIKLVNYISLSIKQHKELLEIRNLPEIRQYTRSMNIIEVDEHLHWVETLKITSKKFYFAILLDSSPIGGVHLIKNKLDTTTWGIFFHPNTATTIISSVTLNFINISFDRFKANTLISIIHNGNINAIRFNERLGFEFSKNNDTNCHFLEMKLSHKRWKLQKEGKILKNIQKLISKIPVEMEK